MPKPNLFGNVPVVVIDGAALPVQRSWHVHSADSSEKSQAGTELAQAHNHPAYAFTNRMELPWRSFRSGAIMFLESTTNFALR